MALGGLVLLALPLAAPGADLVPAATTNPPRWLLGIYGNGFGLGRVAYLGLLVGAFVCYLGVVIMAPQLRGRVIATTIASLIALFVLAPPLLSQDVFSYIAYARLGAVHGRNPYVAVPGDRPADPVSAFVGWHHTSSSYGPLFTVATYPLGRLGVAPALWILKAMAGMAILALAAVTAHIASVRGDDPARAAALVALNPLVLVHVVGGAHNDAVLVLALLGAVAFFVSERQIRGAASLALAFGVKASALFVLPFAVAASDRRGRLVGAFAAASAVVVAVAVGVFGTDAANAIRVVGENQELTSQNSLPAKLAVVTRLPPDVVRVAALAGFMTGVVWLLWCTVKGGDLIRAAGWGAFGLLAASSWLVPWYVIWALPFAALARDRLLTGAVLGLCAFQLFNRVLI